MSAFTINKFVTKGIADPDRAIATVTILIPVVVETVVSVASVALIGLPDMVLTTCLRP